ATAATTLQPCSAKTSVASVVASQATVVTAPAETDATTRNVVNGPTWSSPYKWGLSKKRTPWPIRLRFMRRREEGSRGYDATALRILGYAAWVARKSTGRGQAGPTGSTGPDPKRQSTKRPPQPFSLWGSSVAAAWEVG